MTMNLSRREFGKLSALGTASFLLGSSGCAGLQPGRGSGKPNIVYILADDLGYGELGCYGQEKIKTPHIDQLAATGMRFTQHYSGSPVCAPSRCTLLTGKHSGHAYIRGNDAWRKRGDVWNYEAMNKNPYLEGQRPIPAGTETVGTLLQRQGYKTACIGKWGLGGPISEGRPNKQGFDHFFGFNCQRQAHTLFPCHLWRNEEKVLLNNKSVKPHANLAKGADPNDPDSYKDFYLNDYAPDLLGKEALTFIESNRDQPFFLFYSTPLPHVPLQAPPEYVERYKKEFGPEKPFTGKSYFPHQYPRAAYAAMITYLDDQVGQIVSKLKKTGVYGNTLIIFTSDNGPTYTGGVDAQYFKSAAPFPSKHGRTKGFTHEGGIRVPMIASWPGVIKAGSRSEHISAFWDVLPTLVDVAGGTVPDDTDGISFQPAMRGDRKQPEHEFLYWEFPAYKGQQAVRMGKWKGMRKNIFKGKMKLQLFDLEQDPAEQHDVAALHPEVIKRLEEIMKKEHEPAQLKSFRIRKLGDR